MRLGGDGDRSGLTREVLLGGDGEDEGDLPLPSPPFLPPTDDLRGGEGEEDGERLARRLRGGLGVSGMARTPGTRDCDWSFLLERREKIEEEERREDRIGENRERR